MSTFASPIMGRPSNVQSHIVPSVAWFSSVAAEEPKPKRRKRRRRRSALPTRAPIIVTPGAAERVKFLLSSKDDAKGIRLGVKKRGCNGLSFTMNYVLDTPEDAKLTKLDEFVTCENGVVVYVDPGAMFNIVGTVMDWEETELSAEFTFNNPNSKGECGCGESFNV
ncbi:hypothetical protein TrCOL_g9382 [Triparma columacea]|jgi:iron-sulfur cluster assembly 1|uniref:Core domain-containing protein n=1 Tax=Triparma columacea TaxID=722753 RepID=A0A9W7FY81_9STRA|nr:hypothetical protein TrCOL_g9382 [Triparma columacea]